MEEHDGLDSYCTHFQATSEIIFLAVGNDLERLGIGPKTKETSLQILNVVEPHILNVVWNFLDMVF